jgi:hypothetical protein
MIEIGPTHRRPVGPIIDAHGKMIVVCDDGAVFEFSESEEDWVPWPPIPGSEEADRRDAKLKRVSEELKAHFSDKE